MVYKIYDKAFARDRIYDFNNGSKVSSNMICGFHSDADSWSMLRE